MSSVQQDKLLLRALRSEPLERPPVWLMRQAGRYLPEYRALRQEVGSFLGMARDPEVSAEVTLQPIRRFGMDAAIIFSDILLPLEAMGMELVFDERGPSFPRPVESMADVEALVEVQPAESLAYVGRTLELVRRSLPDSTALIGFCGAPFTLASYAIEGGTSRQFMLLRKMMYQQTQTFELLMDKLTQVVIDHLRFQVESGAEVVMLFDSWAASLTGEDYRRYAMPWSRRVLQALEGLAPRITFAGAAGHLFEDQIELGAEAVAVDHRMNLRQALDVASGRVALQGNLDPALLLASPDEVTRRTRNLLESVRDQPGHILGLGHGVLRLTDPDCVAAFVDAARGA